MESNFGSCKWSFFKFFYKKKKSVDREDKKTETEKHLPRREISKDQRGKE